LPEVTIPAGYGLYLLAAAAVAAMWSVTPAGQKAAQETGKAISKALEHSDSEPITDAPPTTTTDCPDQTKEKDCSQTPCPPPPPPRIDRVPPSKPHFPCAGDHAHFFKYNQNPATCECFLQKIEPPTCLDQGGFPS
jgi:hypothetical protein